MDASPSICPSCAGQLSDPTLAACPWCGASLRGEVEGTTVGPPGLPRTTRADVGFGAGSSRPLPPLPPPPRSLPFENLNAMQVTLRVIIVVGIAWLIAVFGGRALRQTMCSIPNSPFCPRQAP